MKIPFVYQFTEGEASRTGINWRCDWASRLCVIIRFWRLIIYLRWRSANVGGKRFIWGTDWKRSLTMCGVTLDFDLRAIRLNNTWISIDLLDAITEPDPRKTFRFERDVDFIKMTEVTVWADDQN